MPNAPLSDASRSFPRFLPGTAIELIREIAGGARIEAVIFDFDGTLSLIRSGWMDVMVPMMVETLIALETGETEETLERLVRELVTRLTGKQTIYQMIALAEEVTKRGGTPRDPLDYKHRYLDLLWAEIKDRIDGLKSGAIDPREMLVPGSIELLESLKARGIRIFVASGTDEVYAAPEADLLGITPYVEGKVHGAIEDYRSFSKRKVIQNIISDNKLREGALAGIGDGFVEIEDVKAAGGTAVGVATDEPGCGKVDQWKRTRLIRAGADIIIPHYLEHDALSALLFSA